MPYQPTLDALCHMRAARVAFWLRRLRDGDYAYSAVARANEEHTALQVLYLEMSPDEGMLGRPIWGCDYEGKTLGNLLERVANLHEFTEESGREVFQEAISDLFGIYRATGDGFSERDSIRHYWLTGSVLKQ